MNSNIFLIASITIHECQVQLQRPIAPQNMSRACFIFCFVSTICTQILLLWKMLKKH